MKILAMATVVAAATAWAGETGTVVDRKITVCVDPGADGPAIRSAQGLASRLFARIGVKIDWRERDFCPADRNSLLVSFSFNTTPDQRPGALAYALPYEGSHIVLLYDRIQKSHPDLVKQFLAYVLVHEVTHMLEGVSRHSNSGIMKAQWGQEDHFEIGRAHLEFAPEDVDLIYRGLDARVPVIAAVAISVAAN
jgi:hypothetical protein